MRALLRDDTAGDPTGRRGLWTGKRLRAISRELAQLGLRVCPNTVRRLLAEVDYALHANRKSLGPKTPHREEQFDYLTYQRQQFRQSGYPIISEISKHWAGQPLTDYATIVRLIGETQTQTGLRVRCALNTQCYPTKVPISTDQMRKLHLLPHPILPEWNYTLLPRLIRN